jgi:NAD(P)H-hydrate repair Nnr-like enzyme with NAD(P)H-hydrate dehydratase domain
MLANALVIGPGLGRSATALKTLKELLRILASQGKMSSQFLLDADALWFVATDQLVRQLVIELQNQS